MTPNQTNQHDTRISVRRIVTTFSSPNPYLGDASQRLKRTYYKQCDSSGKTGKKTSGWERVEAFRGVKSASNVDINFQSIIHKERAYHAGDRGTHDQIDRH